MASSASSPADVVNLALQRIGYKLRVGHLFDGSTAAKDALDIYAQTRDELLRQNDWGFGERNAALGLLKSAPPGGYIPPNVWNGAIHPPVPWMYEYTYPEDCLKVRAVKPSPLFLPNFDPQPHVFSVENDQAYSPPRKVILCNVPDALIVYTGQVTDPTTWEADFVEALAAALARRLAPALSGLEAVKVFAADEAAANTTAQNEAG